MQNLYSACFGCQTPIPVHYQFASQVLEPSSQQRFESTKGADIIVGAKFDVVAQGLVSMGGKSSGNILAGTVKIQHVEPFYTLETQQNATKVKKETQRNIEKQSKQM